MVIPAPNITIVDDELLIEWPGVLHISVDDEGYAYAVREGDHYRPGVSPWPKAAADIQAVLAKAYGSVEQRELSPDEDRLVREALRASSEPVQTIDDAPCCGSENDYRRAPSRL